MEFSHEVALSHLVKKEDLFTHDIHLERSFETYTFTKVDVVI